MPAVVETMAWNGEVPWHGLGVEVGDNLSPEEMMVASGTNWEVMKVPSFVRVEKVNEAGEKFMQEISTGDSSLVRLSDNRILDNVSDDWNPTQNRDAFNFFHDFVANGDMKMHTAGSLDDGRNVWAMAKVKDGFTLPGGDRVESHLLFSNPHKYGAAINIRFTPIRVVCMNTLSMALGAKARKGVRVTHRKAFDAEAVKKALGLATKMMENYHQAAEFLQKRQYNDESLKKFFGDVFPVLTTKTESKKELSKNAQIALDIIDTQPGAEIARGSWWNAFNAVTFLADHITGKSRDTALTSAWFGAVADTKREALDLAVEYAKAA